MAEKILYGILATLTAGLAFGGWQARDYIETKLASKEEVQVAGTKADYVLDRQMEALISQIAHLEQKANKSRSENDYLKYLRQQLENMRKVRSAK